jgi:hypothetical protein
MNNILIWSATGMSIFLLSAVVVGLVVPVGIAVIKRKRKQHWDGADWGGEE